MSAVKFAILLLFNGILRCKYFDFFNGTKLSIALVGSAHKVVNLEATDLVRLRVLELDIVKVSVPATDQKGVVFRH